MSHALLVWPSLYVYRPTTPITILIKWQPQQKLDLLGQAHVLQVTHLAIGHTGYLITAYRLILLGWQLLILCKKPFVFMLFTI